MGRKRREVRGYWPLASSACYHVYCIHIVYYKLCIMSLL
jgi:hypothetical protein